jgi:predicted Rossmann fold flavoprotein
VPNVIASIPATKFTSTGALLITHEGMSGPAILKLSSFAAREINNYNFRFELNINWIAEKNHDLIRESLLKTSIQNSTKQINTVNPFNLNRRLWEYLLNSFDPDLFPGENPGDIKRWGEAGKKRINRLTHKLASDSYKVTGRSASREEFVTCGGVSLTSINRKTLESNSLPGLYFAGEILDTDALTGGYNLQAAWTTGFIAAMFK